MQTSGRRAHHAIVRSPEQLTGAFRARRLKVTPQRQLLFRLLHDNETHPSAEALYQAASAQMPGISLRTVYQTLTDLVAMGELKQLSVGPGSSRFDPNVDDHHHIVCRSCGDVRDVYLVEDLQPHVDGLRGFEIEFARVVFEGRCASCASLDRHSTTMT